MTTKNGLGEQVTLTYPDGMISWLSSHTSDFDGAKGVGIGNLADLDDTDSMITADSISMFIDSVIEAISAFFANIFETIFNTVC